MVSEHPSADQIPGLRVLWKEAFGDPDWYLDTFFRVGFSPDRCRCISRDDRIAAMLYWFDCTWGSRKIAYVYAVATAKDFRGQGLCHRLMADTHALLRSRGYAGVLLVPQEPSLRKFYGGMGYWEAGTVREFSCTAGEKIPLRAIGPEEFIRLRREYLPEESVLQEGENIRFLQEQSEFFAGKDFLLTAWREDGILHGLELLGDPEAAPGILSALDCREGSFRTPGGETPFGMYVSLTGEEAVPGYFGFAFD